MLTQMFTIAGGILLAFIILTNLKEILQVILALFLIGVAAITVSVLWYSGYNPIETKLPPVEIFGIDLGVWGFLALTIYVIWKCYIEFMKGWRS